MRIGKCPLCKEEIKGWFSGVGDKSEIAFAIHNTKRATLAIDNLALCWRFAERGKSRRSTSTFFINAFEAYRLGRVLLETSVKDKTFEGYWLERGRTLGRKEVV